ncbi:hypothetical protein SO802_027064 [Lithocarpus litseifolius]|uniref:Uncharacterized protein n=1 Tax=Lithocarpus litseifolius TaxID=425828 RepID=A0AAW2C1J3_9ROSI
MSFDGISGDLRAILSSSVGVGEVETDTAISRPALSHQSVLAHSHPLHALQEECSLNEDTLFRFRDRFQFPEETRIRLPRKADGDMITLNELVHLYRLRESKEFDYYELIPWDSRSRLITDLPSSFRYWKLRYFFVSGDGWETLSNDFWGDVPRLLRHWETPVLALEAFLEGLLSSCQHVQRYSCSKRSGTFDILPCIEKMGIGASYLVLVSKLQSLLPYTAHP